jgi:hypothetical protein
MEHGPSLLLGLPNVRFFSADHLKNMAVIMYQPAMMSKKSHQLGTTMILVELLSTVGPVEAP